ncbi:MAG: hypothetical protein JRL30_28230 [Deltaproteobacteria bacterium]|nr:hypothetical protein [Deltaproteobacteria bacterium]
MDCQNCSENEARFTITLTAVLKDISGKVDTVTEGMEFKVCEECGKETIDAISMEREQLTK